MTQEQRNLIYAVQIKRDELQIISEDRDQLIWLRGTVKGMNRLNSRIDVNMFEHIIDDLTMILNNAKDESFPYNPYLLKMCHIKLDIMQTEITVSFYSTSLELYEKIQTIKEHINYVRTMLAAGM